MEVSPEKFFSYCLSSRGKKPTERLFCPWKGGFCGRGKKTYEFSWLEDIK